MANTTLVSGFVTEGERSALLRVACAKRVRASPYREAPKSIRPGTQNTCLAATPIQPCGAEGKKKTLGTKNPPHVSPGADP